MKILYLNSGRCKRRPHKETYSSSSRAFWGSGKGQRWTSGQAIQMPIVFSLLKRFLTAREEISQFFSLSKDNCSRYFIIAIRNWRIHSSFLFSAWNLHLTLWSTQTVGSKPPSLYCMTPASLRCNKCACHHWCFFHGSNPIQVRTSLANYASHFPIAVTEHWTETIKGDDTFILVHSNDAGLLWTEAKMKKSS